MLSVRHAGGERGEGCLGVPDLLIQRLARLLVVLLDFRVTCGGGAFTVACGGAPAGFSLPTLNAPTRPETYHPVTILFRSTARRRTSTTRNPVPDLHHQPRMRDMSPTIRISRTKEKERAELIVLNDALRRPAQPGERKSRFVKLRHFGGLSVEGRVEVSQVSAHHRLV